MLCWAHYGIVSVRYLTQNNAARIAFVIVYTACVCLGSVIASDFIWDIADLSIGAMTLINIALLIKLRGEVKEETELYFKSERKRKKEK